MKRLIHASLIILLLSGSVLAGTVQKHYEPDNLVSAILQHGKTKSLGNNLIGAYLEHHSGLKDRDHISYYAILYLRPLPPVYIALLQLAFNKESWVLKNEVWTIAQQIAIDRDLKGIVTDLRCSVIEEDLAGRIISMSTQACLIKPEDLAKEVIEKTLKLSAI
ncbi:MAG: hypothetical protein HY730_09745 [Candidatus Tectomicrobia bacterium]|uniref:Uncharacterized protein n=1 Tax=Tectimicrobiota bacterium TaxID=2528274 RepID=A0A933LQX9_UNCTE|nr:hypothetical protein [Candidatus Tectomicrobia bacterium]